MKQFFMKPFGKPPAIDVVVPGSKSITNRALLIAALADGESVLQGVLFSDDSRVFMEALKTLGFPVDIDEENAVVKVTGLGGKIPEKKASVYVGSAGTAARFLTAMLALSGGTYEVTSSDQMKRRPMRPLLEALELLGTRFEYMEEPYAFPFRILGREIKGYQEIPLNIDASSQFLSALLLAGVMQKEGFRIHLTGTRDARSYVNISMKMMDAFGCRMQMCGEDDYEILPDSSYLARTYQIEPDVSAACYFYAMAAVNGGSARVKHVHKDSTQGDIRFLELLQKMGCTCMDGADGICLRAPKDGVLHGLTVDMSDFSDQTMTLAAVAPFADGPVVIHGVGHIRNQESDRLGGIAAELSGMGIDCEILSDGIRIQPGHVEPAVIHTYNDHRMAMAFAVIGTKVPGIVIDDPECCRKTFEKYFNVLTNLDLRLK